MDANQERESEWEQAQYDSASTKQGQAYNSYMQHNRNQQNMYMEMARTQGLSQIPTFNDAETTQEYYKAYPLQARLDSYNRLAQNRQYDHKWETNSIILPYVVRNHAFNFDEHD